MFLTIDKPVIDFIGDHDQVVFFCNFGDGFQIFTFGNRAGGVIGVTQQDGFGPGSDRFFDHGWVWLEIILHGCVDFDRFPARQSDLCLVGDKTRCGDDDFVPGVKQSREGEIEGFRDAHGYDNLVDGVIMHAIALSQVLRNSCTQFHNALVGSVMSLALSEGLHPGFNDRLGRGEVRLTNPEGDDIFHGGGNIEEFPDSGRFQVDHSL